MQLRIREKGKGRVLPYQLGIESLLLVRAKKSLVQMKPGKESGLGVDCGGRDAGTPVD